MHHCITALLLPLALALPAQPLVHTLTARQESSTDSAIAEAIANLFGGSFAAFHTPSSSDSTDSGVAAASTSTSSATNVSFSNCAVESSVSRVVIEPCEGGSGEEGDACVFTQGKNYTITISFTSPHDVAQAQARTGLASFEGNQQTAYSGQSFSACTYTSCPIQAGVEATYTYPFRTLAAPPFDRLVFNATNGIGGPSIMCADIPATFKAA